ncbi:MAG TPA: Uma2 family endonuclease [Blastocatellia bacterium]|nr:Uma2 family endonuclease [Blastocatellia bacterium]
MAANPNETPRHYYSLDEYFALEHAGDARYEYWDGDIVCMSGGSQSHNGVAGNIHYRLRQKLEGRDCRAFIFDMALKTPTFPPYRYPDVMITCGDAQFENVRGVDALINPILIVEVLSPTTARRDREEKFAAYQTIPSFKEYLLITQDLVHVSHYVRQVDGRWSREDIIDIAATLTLESIDCVLSMQEIYEGIAFQTL